MDWHTSTPPKDCEIFAYCYSYDEIGKYFCMLKWDESCKYFVETTGEQYSGNYEDEILAWVTKQELLDTLPKK